MGRVTAALLVCVLCAVGQPLFARGKEQDRAVFVEVRDRFLEQLKVRARPGEGTAEGSIELKMDFTGVDVPRRVSEFRQAWHFPSRSQDLTGSCWAFSSISFLESEIYRLSGRVIKLSEMYPVYWEFVEKARRFVRERGDSEFGRGSEVNATLRILKQYGAVPAEAYNGRPSTQEFYDDRQAFSEMKAYLQSVKERNAWDEEAVVRAVRAILDRHLGIPPSAVSVDGERLPPQEYLTRVLALDLNAYVDVLSLAEQPFYQKVEFPVPDNWWHSKDYYNVPVDEFMSAIKRAVRQGYTLCLVGDNSEPGFWPPLNVAVVPTFDIPARSIDDYARQLRFSQENTTDDHAVHLVGYLPKDDGDWYLIKDSGSKSRNGIHEGYMFYREDFVKLKMLSFLVHRDAVRDLLARFGE